MYTQEYKDFWLVTLDQEGHEKTCNYWYLVQSFGATPHTAFTKRESLLCWLALHGIQLTKSLPEHGTHSVQRLAGKYKSTSHMNPSEFYAIEGTKTPRLDNGDYTLGIIAHEEDGTRNIHYLNCNVRERPVYVYAETRAQVG